MQDEVDIEVAAAAFAAAFGPAPDDEVPYVVHLDAEARAACTALDAGGSTTKYAEMSDAAAKDIEDAAAADFRRITKDIKDAREWVRQAGENFNADFPDPAVANLAFARLRLARAIARIDGVVGAYVP